MFPKYVEGSRMFMRLVFSKITIVVRRGKELVF